jgi:hypothetical protein
MEVAKSWYDSPGYRAIRHHRQHGAKYIGILMEGGILPPNQRMPQTIGNRPAYDRMIFGILASMMSVKRLSRIAIILNYIVF